jgi:hypothetical protein
MGLAAELWTPVSVGQTIGVDVHPWIQWRVSLEASAGQTPSVTSITINWLITNTVGIRVASLFFDQTYYIAAAEYGNTTNNIVLYYDWKGRWGQYSGLNINTMGLFFGNPYFGDALVGNYTKWIDPSIINSDVIDFMIVTKSYSSEIVSDDKAKLVRHLIVKCTDYLSTIYPEYSVDEGVTWRSMTDIVTGLTYYAGSNTGNSVTLRFSAVSGSAAWGYGVMYRIRNSDEWPVEIMSMKTKVLVTDRPVLLRS